MRKYGLSELRRSTGYRIFSYASYFCLTLFLINYFKFAGTSNVLLGMFIMFFLFLLYLSIGVIFLLYASDKIHRTKDIETHNKTNLIHDIGVMVYFIILTGVPLAIIFSAMFTF